MYLLDANTFMEGSRLYYAFDIAPGFWTWLADPALSGQVASIEAVRNEIIAGHGDLVDWAKQLPRSFWLAESAQVVRAMTDLAKWASSASRKYTQAAVTEFMGSADLGLVAHALVGGATVVTREQPAPEAKKRIKIPDVCDAFRVAWSNPFAIYRQLGLRLT